MHHIADEDIFLDHAGFSTYESMYRGRDVFLMDNVIVISQEFHLPRAIYIARKLGLNAVGYVAKEITPSAESKVTKSLISIIPLDSQFAKPTKVVSLMPFQSVRE